MSSRPNKTDLGGICKSCGHRTVTVSISVCPNCGGPVVGASPGRRIAFLSVPPMLYQRCYVWFVLVSALDLMLTWTILALGGSEVNAVADAVIAATGHLGIIAYKFALMVLVILISEVVGRRRPRVGRKLAEWSVAVTAIPVALSIIQLVTH